CSCIAAVIRFLRFNLVGRLVNGVEPRPDHHRVYHAACRKTSIPELNPRNCTMVSPASMTAQNIPRPRRTRAFTRRRAKIVATLGPSVAGIDNLRKLVESGMDIARINSAHGSLEQRAEFIKNLRTIGEELGRFIPVLLDLRG